MSSGEKFTFGRNWKEFLARHLTDERRQRAQASLMEFLQQPSLEGRSFLDVGCGSGLFSLAAFRMGASRIVSLDVDPGSVECTEQLRQSVGSPAHWTVLQGSIMDSAALAGLQPADVVYAWGSLPFTGDMWQAIRNVSALVAEDGLLYLAVYNRREGRRGSEFWLKMKRRYHSASRPVQRMMELSFMFLNAFVLPWTRLETPWGYIRRYAGETRGMSLWIDLKDWLGGYPYEFASADEVFRFCRQECGLELRNLKTTASLGNNEFLFHRPVRVAQPLPQAALSR